MNNNTPVEIERKYVIRMPELSRISEQPGYTVSDIYQTYLDSEPHVTHRVRRREYGDGVSYTETKKVRIDRLSSFEDEREIDEGEYAELLKKRRAGTVTLRKTRHTFICRGCVFEIDIYPEWRSTCILETELSSRDETVLFPDFISVVAEVTGDRRYSNASMSRKFPDELI